MFGSHIRASSDTPPFLEQGEAVRIAGLFERADLDVVDAHLKGLLDAYGDGGGPLKEEAAFPHGRERVVEERQLRLLHCAPMLLAQWSAVPVVFDDVVIRC